MEGEHPNDLSVKVIYLENRLSHHECLEPFVALVGFLEPLRGGVLDFLSCLSRIIEVETQLHELGSVGLGGFLSLGLAGPWVAGAANWAKGPAGLFVRRSALVHRLPPHDDVSRAYQACR